MKKKRYWAFVLYPESAPINWRDILQQTGLAIAISPLHDKDIDPTGQPKKAHYHIILCYDGPTTFNNVKSNITDVLNQPIPIPLEQVRGYFRYLTHKDNPDKFQYNEKDISIINDFDIDNYNDLTISQVNEIKKQLITFIQENNITEYCNLLDLLLSKELFSMLDVAMNHTILLNTYICSYRNYLRDLSSSSAVVGNRVGKK